MSLLKLNSKTEPLYTNKNIINYDENFNKEMKLENIGVFLAEKKANAIKNEV